MNRCQEFSLKLERLQKLIGQKKYSGILLTRRSNFSWLTCGGQNHVGGTTDFGVGHLLVVPNQVYLLASNIESSRIMTEECEGLPIEAISYPWYQESSERKTRLAALVDTNNLAMDAPGAMFDVTSEVMQVRHPLLEPEIQRYRQLGADAARIMVQTCHELSPGMTELEVAARLSAHCTALGLEPTVRLVAFDERTLKYRHPVPTARKLKTHAMLVLGARRMGLIVSLSRMVHFGKISAELQKKHEAVCRVDTVLNLASCAGAKLGEILSKGIKQYEIEGFLEEWTFHHQGGLTGYEGRDVRALPDSSMTLSCPTAVAWNPTIAGTKSEDTFLVTESGVENLTLDSDIPKKVCVTEFGTLQRSDILVQN